MNHGLEVKNKLNNKTILITGASGFIGGRIIERLCRDYHCSIKALVHNINNSTRICRFNIEILKGDVLDKTTIEKITKDVDYIIHCAHGNTANAKVNRQITVYGTKNVVLAALKNKVSRIVYLSTMSVYGYPLPEKCNEQTPYKRVERDFYNNNKIDAENIVWKYIQKGLQAIILQPTIVYGPYAHWTTVPVNELKSDGLFLVNEGCGFANTLFIDNLIDAIFLSLSKKEAIGEKFIISDGKPVLWRTFYSFYKKMLPENKLSKLSNLNKYKLKIFSLPISLALSVRKFYDPLSLLRNYPEITTKIIAPLYRRYKSIESLSQDKNRQIFFQDKCVFEIEKAKKILGYSPKISISEGMRKTEEWLKYSRYIK